MDQNFFPSHIYFDPKKFFCFSHPYWYKKNCLFTPLLRQSFCFTLPKKLYTGNQMIVPPKKQPEQHFPLPDLSAAPPIKKGSHFLQSSSAFSSSDYISRLLRRQSHPFFVLILRLCSLKYKDPSLLLCMLGIGGCCINRGGGFFFNLPSISDLAFRLSWRHRLMVVIFPVEGKSRWRRKNKTPSYKHLFWQIKYI